MPLFGNFFKRKNKNAEHRPLELRDYVPLTAETFSRDGTSFACIDRIASELAQLNFGIYDRLTRAHVKRNWLYNVLSQPNLEEDRFLFLYNCVVDYYNGGVYIYLSRNIEGHIVSMFRLAPDQVKIMRDEHNRRIFHCNGRAYTDDEILYIPSRYDYSTLKGGKSIFDAVKGTFDASRKLEQYTKATFNNSISGKRLVVDISQALPDATPEQIAELKANIQAEYAGVENASRPLIKRKGVEYSELGTNAVSHAEELADNRTLQKNDVAMLFGVPAGLISGDSRSVDTEKDFTLFCEFAIKPLATQFQQAFNRLLEGDYYLEFDFNGMLKVSLRQRIDAYKEQIGIGILSLNEVRAKENLGEVEEGDTHFIPANYMPWNTETKDAYMAKQKIAVKELKDTTNTDEGVLNSQHMPQGDDKN